MRNIVDAEVSIENDLAIAKLTVAEGATEASIDFAAINQIKQMIETMPLSLINEAMDKVLAGKARYRIVLVSDPNN